MAMTNEQIRLVAAAQKGDVKSFEELYVTYYGKIYAFAKMILKNDRDAEDILQNTFITAWKKLNTLQTPQTFSVWLQIIAKNLCNDQLKRKSFALLLDADKEMENFECEESDELLPAVYAERADLKDRLSQIIESLSDAHRQTIVLYYFNELSVEEIADVMQCSPGTVKSRLYFARKAIRTEVEEQERKSGERFYGITGIPLLPLGKLVKSHMESLSISQNAANASLSAIKTSISVSPASGANAAVTAAKPLSMAVRIIMAAAVVAAVGAATLFAIVLIFDGMNGADTPDGTGSDSAANPAASHVVPSGGLPQSSLPAKASATSHNGVSSTKNDLSTDALSHGAPDNSSGYASSGKDRLSAAIDGLPGKNSLDELYSLIAGYWITDGRTFVYFLKDMNGNHRIEYGIYATSFGGGGRITGSKAAGTHKAELIIFDPGKPADELDSGRPASTDTVLLDFADFNQNGTIKIKIEKLGGNEWVNYKFGGSNPETAYG